MNGIKRTVGLTRTDAPYNTTKLQDLLRVIVNLTPHTYFTKRKASYLVCRKLATITQREAVAKRLHKAHQVTEEEQQRLNFEMLVIQMNLLSLKGYTIC